MSFTKFASLEDVEILDLKGSTSQVKTASLDKIADFDDFRTDDGYLYARIRAISSRVNKNHDGWPSIELAGGQDIFDKHASQAKTAAFTAAVESGAKYGYSTFLGKPIFVDHNNSDPSRARGVIVDAKLHVEDQKTAALDPYYASEDVNPLHVPPTWVELLLEVDAKSFPKFAQAILDGSKDSTQGIDGFSMGANVERTECNICKNSASTPDEFCDHIRNKGALYDYIDPVSGRKTAKRSYEDCFGVQFFEISGVFDPADETALIREVVSSNKQSSVNQYHAIKDSEEYTPENKAKLDELWAQLSKIMEKEDPAFSLQTESIAPHHEDPRWNRISNEKTASVKPLVAGGGTSDISSGFLFDSPEQSEAVQMKTAGNPKPQSELTHVPDEVDTLRKERVCEVCGSTMDSEQCDVCGYIEPPEGFDNPDLTKATPSNANENIQLEPNGLASNPPTTAHVKSDMSWNVSIPSRVAETIVTPNKGPASDEPVEEVIEDPAKPVTSSVRTAEDFLAAAGAKPRRTKMKRNADAAMGAPEIATPDTNVDADGVGGVMDATNESASKADHQIPVEGIGGTNPNVDAQDTISVDQGDEKSKNIEVIPTKTFGQGGSAVERQADPVSSKPFPSKGSAMGWRIEALDSGAFPRTEDSAAGGSASKGTTPADPYGNAMDRVDVTQPATSPSNNSGPTKTWSGTDGSGVTRQQEPTTNQSLEGPDGVKSSARLMTAFKLADLEIELGLLEKQGKYARVEELQGQSDDAVASALAYAEKVKTAGLSKGSPKTASRFPSFARGASVESSKSGKTVTPDEALFS